MGRYQDQIDGINVICPYCEHEYEPDREEFSDHEREQTCDTCGNVYWISQSVSVEHHTSPDCELNHSQHQWVPWDEFPSGCYVCNVCGCRKLIGGRIWHG